MFIKELYSKVSSLIVALLLKFIEIRNLQYLELAMEIKFDNGSGHEQVMSLAVPSAP